MIICGNIRLLAHLHTCVTNDVYHLSSRGRKLYVSSFQEHPTILKCFITPVSTGPTACVTDNNMRQGKCAQQLQALYCW